MDHIKYATRILKGSHEELLEIVTELSVDCPGLSVHPLATSMSDVDLAIADDGSVKLLFSAIDLIALDPSNDSRLTQTMMQMFSGRDELVLRLANCLSERQEPYLCGEQEVPLELTTDELSVKLGVNESSIRSLGKILIQTSQGPIPVSAFVQDISEVGQ